MKFSVIIPSYNRAHLIADAIDSVLNQTYTNFELIVVDDHSIDNTKEVVEQYRDERVNYVLNARTKGAQGARNTGLNLAGGDWVAMLDSDDVWKQNKLEEIYVYINSYGPDAIGFSSGWEVINVKTGTVLEVYKPKYDKVVEDKLLYSNYIGSFSTFIFKREYGLKAGGFDERFPAKQDHEFYVRLSDYGKITISGKILVSIRVGSSDRITADFTRKHKAASLFGEKFKIKLENNFKARIHNHLVINTYALLSKDQSKWFSYIWYLLLSALFNRSGFKKYSLLLLSVKMK